MIFIDTIIIAVIRRESLCDIVTLKIFLRLEMKSEKILVGLVTQIVKMHVHQIANNKLGNTLLMEKMEVAENSSTIAS